MGERFSARKKKILLFILILAAAVFFWQSAFLQSVFYNSVSFLEGYLKDNKIWGGAFFVLLAALSAMLSPFSSVPLVPIAIVIWSEAVVFFLLLLGWVLGGALTYLIGNYAVEPVLNRLTSKEKINHYKAKVSGKLNFFLVLIFRLGMPAEIPGYVLGILKYSFPKYFLATFLAELPFALITVYGSDALLNEKKIIFVSSLILGVIIMGLALHLFKKKIQ